MALRTQIFNNLPWVGGVNTALDASMIPVNQLVEAKNVVFGTRGSRKKRDSINFDWDSASTANQSMIGLHDFWYGTNARTQTLVGISDSKKIYKYNSSGVRTEVTLDSGATAWGSAISTASMTVLNNFIIMAVDGSANVMRKWAGGTELAYDLGQYGGGGFPASVSRSSTGTTRTLVFATDVSPFLSPGNLITITGSGSASYNGSFTILTVSTTMITFTGSGSLAEASTPDTAFRLRRTNLPPKASVVRTHLGRVWANDKENKDRLHYSPAFDPETWQGEGDSGAIDIGVGDGDPEGITAIFPTFKGALFIAKKTKLYRISGYSPEEFVIELVSSGIGCISHNAIAQIDQDEMVYISDRGVHSLSATQAYGDFVSSYLSADIQATFNNQWTKSRLKYSQAVYLSNLNSVLFAVSDSDSDTASNKTIWLYNLPLKAWYSWPNVSCQSLTAVTDSDMVRAYLGTNSERVAKTLTGVNFDTDVSGNPMTIPFRVKTGLIFPDGQPYITKGFKRLGLLYRPKGPHTITATIQIDNFTPQSIAFTEIGSIDRLDIDFVLDQSILDYTVVMAPYSLPIDGFGRGFTVTLEQSGIDEQIEIQGFLVEYEVASTQQQTRLGDAT